MFTEVADYFYETVVGIKSQATKDNSKSHKAKGDDSIKDQQSKIERIDLDAYIKFVQTKSKK